MNLLNKHNNMNSILQYCLRDLNKGYRASQIAKELKLNQKSVSNYFNKLEKEKFVFSEIEGRNKIFYFNFKEKKYAFHLLFQTELNKTLSLRKKYFKISEILDKLKEFFPNYYLIFGSYAKGLAKEESDLDIICLGSYNQKKLREISKFYNIEINVKSISKEDFIESLNKKDTLINEIVKDYIIISGYEFFIENIVKHYYKKW